MLKTKQIAIIFNPKLSLYGCFGKKLNLFYFLFNMVCMGALTNTFFIMNLTKLQLS